MNNFQKFLGQPIWRWKGEYYRFFLQLIKKDLMLFSIWGLICIFLVMIQEDRVTMMEHAEVSLKRIYWSLFWTFIAYFTIYQSLLHSTKPEKSMT